MSDFSKTVKIKTWESVFSFDDLIDNVGVCVLVNQQQIAVFRLSGSDKLYAIDNYDPFGNASVLSRGICGDLKGKPVVASPLHKQHFNLNTGQCLEDENIKIPVYPIRISEGKIQIDTT